MGHLSDAVEVAPQLIRGGDPRLLLDPGNYPFYEEVPKGFEANLAYRADIIRDCHSSVKSRASFIDRCSRDMLFWANTCLFVYNPRKRKGRRKVPLITWPFQDVCLDVTRLHILGDGFEVGDNRDLVYEKSREMAATWNALIVFAHHFQWDELSSFLSMSRKEELVDRTGDPKTLFWKFDFLIQNQPKFLQPRVESNKRHRRNLGNGSTFDGETTVDPAGDRRTAVLLDEFSRMENATEIMAASRDLTDCRVFVSTHRGVGTAFYDICERSKTRKLWCHWTVHPEKNEGLYMGPDGKARSPWYDRECIRSGDPVDIAENLDISPFDSDYNYYSMVQDKLLESVRPPYVEGDWVFGGGGDRITGFVESPQGKVRLWYYPREDGSPEPGDAYVMGADIALGSGSEESSLTPISVVSVRDRALVAEWCSHEHTPEQAARVMAAMGYLFRGVDDEPAKANWETNGAGGVFGKTLIHDLRYRRLWYRKKREDGIARETSELPGWHTSGAQGRLSLHSQLRMAIHRGHYVERDPKMREETKYYVFKRPRMGGSGAKGGGGVGDLVHVKSASSRNPSDVGENHGDRVVSRAVALMPLLEVESEVRGGSEQAPVSGFLQRRRAREARKRESEEILW